MGRQDGAGSKFKFEWKSHDYVQQILCQNGFGNNDFSFSFPNLCSSFRSIWGLSMSLHLLLTAMVVDCPFHFFQIRFIDFLAAK